jgi:hypothetical protein
MAMMGMDSWEGKGGTAEQEEEQEKKMKEQKVKEMGR